MRLHLTYEIKAFTEEGPVDVIRATTNRDEERPVRLQSAPQSCAEIPETEFKSFELLLRWRNDLRPKFVVIGLHRRFTANYVLGSDRDRLLWLRAVENDLRRPLVPRPATIQRDSANTTLSISNIMTVP